MGSDFRGLGFRGLVLDVYTGPNLLGLHRTATIRMGILGDLMMLNGIEMLGILNPRDDFLDAPVSGVLLVLPLDGAGVSGPSGEEPVPAVGLAGVLGALGPAFGATRFKEARSAAAFSGSAVQGARLDALVMSFQGRIRVLWAHIYIQGTPQCATHGSKSDFTVPSCISRFPGVVSRFQPGFHGEIWYPSHKLCSICL